MHAGCALPTHRKIQWKTYSKKPSVPDLLLGREEGKDAASGAEMPRQRLLQWAEMGCISGSVRRSGDVQTVPVRPRSSWRSSGTRSHRYVNAAQGDRSARLSGSVRAHVRGAEGRL
uniref:Uncharacterized protein n=1 Tax=Knipowitschia caucasica TaxID=637954 RepID=A0AAV2LLJ2_KNICA